MTLDINSEWQRARQIVEGTGMFLFLTGKAGTGKTAFLRRLKEDSPKRMIVLAPTGIAAINAGGMTLHSFFQLPFTPFVPDTVINGNGSRLRLGKEKIRIIRSMDLLVIDEVSMIRADLLDAVDAVLRRYRDHARPFGGVQLLLIGDLHQLAPVIKEDEWRLLSPHYETPYFFSSRSLRKIPYVAIELKQVYRQSDPRFIALLNKIRENEADDMLLRELNSRYIPSFVPPHGDSYIHLTTHNRQAQSINDRELRQLPGREYNYEAEITGNFSEYAYPTDRNLVLKLGAQVMFVKNDPSPAHRYYNGMIGEICRIDENGFAVEVGRTGRRIEVEPEEWTGNKYVINEKTKEITEETEGRFKQFPVKPAWAITVHKSQGLTFEHAVVDIHASFAHGQAYVALSRCRSLEGLVLSSPISASSIISDRTVERYIREMKMREPNGERVRELRREYFLFLLDELFGFDGLSHLLDGLSRLLEEHFYRLYPLLATEYKAMPLLFEQEIRQVALRFHRQYELLVMKASAPETDAELQSRLRKGAEYFGKELEPLAALAGRIDLQTDNKVLKKRADTAINELREALSLKQHLLEQMKEYGFTIEEYLKWKAHWSLEGTVDKRNIEKEKKPKGRMVVEVPTDILYPELYDRLVDWRSAKAESEHLPVYTVLKQKALMGIANLLPNNTEALAIIPFFGAKSLKKYGVELLSIVNTYMEEKQLERPEIKKVFVPVPEEKVDTKTLSFRMYKDGMSLEEIAEERSLTEGTVFTHLAHFVKEGELDLYELISAKHAKRIENLLRKYPVEDLPSLSVLKDALEENISYNEIRLIVDLYRTTL